MSETVSEPQSAESQLTLTDNERKICASSRYTEDEYRKAKAISESMQESRDPAEILDTAMSKGLDVLSSSSETAPESMRELYLALDHELLVDAITRCSESTRTELAFELSRSI